MQTDTPVFTNWLNRFFDSYYNLRPVNATFIGAHDRDHRLPDFSENGAGDTLADMQSLLLESQQIEHEPLSAIEKIDLRLAQGFLKTQIWEYQSNHFHRGNPSLYTGEAVFGVMSLFLTATEPFGSVRQRLVDAATERMNSIPTLLAQGKKNVTQAPLAWTERAIRECEGALAFLTEGVDLLITANQITDPKFKAAAENAAAAFFSFQTYLKSELRCQPSEHYACGDEVLALYLSNGHFLDIDANAIVQYAAEQMDEAADYLMQHAVDFDAANKHEALKKLPDIHPTTEQYYARYQELWDMVHETAEAESLLTWPDFPIRYVPRPAWTRKAAPYLYFLFYRSPAAFNRPPVHDYLVTPIDQTMPLSEQQRMLKLSKTACFLERLLCT